MEDNFSMLAKHKCHMGHFSGYIIEQAITDIYQRFIVTIIDRRTQKILWQHEHKISFAAMHIQNLMDNKYKDMQEVLEKRVTDLYLEHEIERILLGEG